MKIEIIKGDENPAAESFSSPSNTPETDALEQKQSSEGCPQWNDIRAMRWVKEHAALARKLERERDEARQHLKEIEEYGTDEINAAVDLRRNLAQVLVNLDDMQDRLDLAMKVMKRIERERDEASAEAKLLKKTPLRQRCQELERLSDHWCDMHTVASKERDEAREKNARLRDIAERAIWRAVNGVCLPDASAVRAIKAEGLRLRAELDQLKQGAKCYVCTPEQKCWECADDTSLKEGGK